MDEVPDRGETCARHMVPAMEFRHERPRKPIKGILVTHSVGTWPLKWPAMIEAGSSSRELRSARESVTPSFGAMAWLGTSHLNGRENHMKAVYGRLARTARMGVGFALVLTALAGVVHAGGEPSPPPLPTSAPEIDPGSMASALTLLMGGAFLVT